MEIIEVCTRVDMEMCFPGGSSGEKLTCQDTACLGLVHRDDPEGCCGEGGGRGVHVWDHMYTHGGFMSMYGKTNTVW